MCILGYPPNQKAYKVLDLSTNKILISRDVIFYEKHFPFHFSSSPSQAYTKKFFLPTSTPSIPYSASDLPEIFSSSDSIHTSISTPSSSSTQSISSSLPTREHTHIPLRQSTRPTKPPTHLSAILVHLIGVI